MDEISLNKDNFASVAHTGYLGTIAVDNELHKFLERIEVPAGWAVDGAKIYIGNIGPVSELRDYPIDVVLQRMGETGWEYCIVSRRVDLLKMFTSSINIEIRLTSNSNFERDRIDWDNLPDFQE